MSAEGNLLDPAGEREGSGTEEQGSSAGGGALSFGERSNNWWKEAERELKQKQFVQVRRNMKSSPNECAVLA